MNNDQQLNKIFKLNILILEINLKLLYIKLKLFLTYITKIIVKNTYIKNKQFSFFNFNTKV